MIYKKTAINVLRSMVDESLEFVKAHIDWITTHDLEDPLTAQVERGMRNHLMVLHHAFPVIREIFQPDELEQIVSEELLKNIEKIYIEGLKEGYVLPCECNYCVDYPVKEPNGN